MVKGLGTNIRQPRMEHTKRRDGEACVGSQKLEQETTESRYNRQGRKANRRSRDSCSNRAYSRTQTVRNTGTHNLPLYLTRATISCKWIGISGVWFLAISSFNTVFYGASISSKALRRQPSRDFRLQYIRKFTQQQFDTWVCCTWPRKQRVRASRSSI